MAEIGTLSSFWRNFVAEAVAYVRADLSRYDAGMLAPLPIEPPTQAGRRARIVSVECEGCGRKFIGVAGLHIHRGRTGCGR